MLTYNYATVSEALNKLREAGYTLDFNLPEHLAKFDSGEFKPEDFKIDKIYRYEGQSDPGDEAIVYAISSGAGIKGVLVSGFGVSANKSAQKFLESISGDKNHNS